MTTKTARLLLGTGAILATALLLASCDSTKDQVGDNATVSGSPTAAANASDPAAIAAGAESGAGHDAGEMERHQRQEMDHQEMRMGGMNAPTHSATPTTPAPQQGGDQTMPMPDM